MNIVFFTGAGISAESKVDTFRGSGLWDKYDINEVATINAWRKNKKKCLDFYNLLCKTVVDNLPNQAHLYISELESNYNVSVITQNVDDYHEMSGSSNVLHLHGDINYVRSTVNNQLISWDRERPILLGDKCERGSQVRPNVIFFGENLDKSILVKAVNLIKECDILVIVGTSLLVQPANSLPLKCKPGVPIYYIDTVDKIDDEFDRDIIHIRDIASTGIKKLIEEYL